MITTQIDKELESQWTSRCAVCVHEAWFMMNHLTCKLIRSLFALLHVDSITFGHEKRQQTQTNRLFSICFKLSTYIYTKTKKMKPRQATKNIKESSNSFCLLYHLPKKNKRISSLLVAPSNTPNAITIRISFALSMKRILSLSHTHTDIRMKTAQFIFFYFVKLLSDSSIFGIDASIYCICCSFFQFFLMELCGCFVYASFSTRIESHEFVQKTKRKEIVKTEKNNKINFM